jgi:Reverse transcriptase (RNA-dependent DNA polymerase)
VPVQSAYRPHHSTETALLKVVNDLLISIDNGDAAVLALLDQSAAFDTIDHSILLNRLNACFGVSGSVLSWFTSCLSRRFQSVSISGVTSAAVLLLYGVPQGSVLGPVLFTLYNSPIHSISLKHGVSDHFYADDEQIYVSFPLVPDHSAQAHAYSLVANCVGETKNWMSDNLIQFNDQKSDALVCYSRSSRLKPTNTPLVLGEASITPSDTVRNLGVTLDTRGGLAPFRDCGKHLDRPPKKVGGGGGL